MDLNATDTSSWYDLSSIFRESLDDDIGTFMSSIGRYDNNYIPDKYIIKIMDSSSVCVTFINTLSNIRSEIWLELLEYYDYTKQVITNLDRFYRDLTYKYIDTKLKYVEESTASERKRLIKFYKN